LLLLQLLLLLLLLLLVLYYRKYRLLLLLALLMLLELPYQPNNQCNRIALTFIILNGATFLFLHWKKYPPFDHVESIFVSLNKYITVVCVNQIRRIRLYISLQKSKYKMFVLVVKCILVCVKISIVAAVVI
jgi:hypothetical protein